MYNIYIYMYLYIMYKVHGNWKIHSAIRSTPKAEDLPPKGQDHRPKRVPRSAPRGVHHTIIHHFV